MVSRTQKKFTIWAKRHLINKKKAFRKSSRTRVAQSFLRNRQKRRYLAVKIAEVFASKSFTAHFAGRLLMTPPETTKTESSLSFLKRGNKLSIPLDEKEISAWSFGDGPLILLVHGWGGHGAQLKSFVDPLVQSGHRVVLFDAYGHGESGGEVSSVVHIARSIKAVLANYEDRPKAVIAHSMGTSALLLHLSIYKTEIDFLALISAPFEGPLLHSKKFAEKIKISEEVRSLMQGQLEWELDHPWSELEIPALLPLHQASKIVLIHDEKDKAVPVSSLEQIHRVLPDANILRTTGLGHLRILEDSEVVEYVMKHLGATKFSTEKRRATT